MAHAQKPVFAYGMLGIRDGKFHIPSDLVVEEWTSHVGSRLALDFAFIRHSRRRDLPEIRKYNGRNINGLRFIPLNPGESGTSEGEP